MGTGFSGTGGADGTGTGARPGWLSVGGGTVPTAGCTRSLGKRAGLAVGLCGGDSQVAVLRVRRDGVRVVIGAALPLLRLDTRREGRWVDAWRRRAHGKQ